MSLVKQIAEVVKERGPCTAESLLPLFPTLCKRQVFQAVRNARQYGYLDLVEGQRHKGYGGGSFPGLYAAKQESPERVSRAVSSVWQLGAA